MSRRQQDLFPELPDGKKYVSDIPELVADWHPTKNEGKKPEDFSFGSNTKVWWQCKNGHEWETQIYHRTHGTGCPVCYNERRPEAVRPKTSPDFNLLTENPSLCVEWDYKQNKYPPSHYLPNSGASVFWKCPIGVDHVWKARIASRSAPDDKVSNGCPFCAGRKPSLAYNLEVIHPELLKEWCFEKNQKPPEEFTPKSNHSVWWKCIEGHEWKSKINYRANGRNCPECNIKSSRNEMRILTELMSCFDIVLSRRKVDGFEINIFLPDLAIGIEYDGSYWHADKLEYDLKKQKALEKIGIKLIRVRERPLNKISPDDILVERVEELSKATVDELLSKINPNALSVMNYTQETDWLKDDLYRNYLDNFPSPLPENSLAENNPSLCNEWHPTKNMPLVPQNFTPNSGQKVWWLCEIGHEWEATIDSRNSNQRPSSCPYCSPTRKIASEENNLAKTRPDVAMYFHTTKNGDETPEKLVEGTGELLWWRCENGHEWQQRGYAMLKVKGHLCPTCRKLQ